MHDGHNLFNGIALCFAQGVTNDLDVASHGPSSYAGTNHHGVSGLCPRTLSCSASPVLALDQSFFAFCPPP